MDKAKGWDKAAADFQRLFKNGQNEYNRRLFAFLQANCGLRDGISVIDIGCGVGKYGMMLAERGCSVTLTDISPRMLEYAAENLSAFKSPWRTVPGAFEELGEELGCGYDLAMSTMCPAIHDVNTVKKMSALSHGCCFISRFFKWSQPNRDKVFEALGAESDAHRDSGEVCRGLIEAVKTAGYRPQVCYVDYNWCDVRPAAEEAEYLRRRCGLGEYSHEQVLSAVEALCDEKGFFADAVNTEVMWIYWRS